MIEKLTVLYDPRCAVCRHASQWLKRQVQVVRLELLPAGSYEALQKFPKINHEATFDDVHAIDNHGGVYIGSKAWLMILWCLDTYRSLSIRLAAPKYANQIFNIVKKISKYRPVR